MLGKAIVDDVIGFLGDFRAGFARYVNRIHHGIERYNETSIDMFLSVGIIRRLQNVLILDSENFRHGGFAA